MISVKVLLIYFPSSHRLLFPCHHWQFEPWGAVETRHINNRFCHAIYVQCRKQNVNISACRTTMVRYPKTENKPILNFI